jgi:hypothetical protein
VGQRRHSSGKYERVFEAGGEHPQIQDPNELRWRGAGARLSASPLLGHGLHDHVTTDLV